MADIATIWDAAQGIGAWQISPDGDLLSDETLYTAVIISLFTDAAAGPDDVIPDGSTDPRGWWGDANIGSKIWLRMRSKATATALALVKADIETALQWLIDDDIAATVSVTTEWTRPSMLGGRVEILRRDGTRVALSFARLWETI